jgi:hypothetical protein
MSEETRTKNTAFLSGLLREFVHPSGGQDQRLTPRRIGILGRRKVPALTGPQDDLNPTRSSDSRSDGFSRGDRPTETQKKEETCLKGSPPRVTCILHKIM